LERKTSSSIGKKIALSEDGDSIKWTKVDVATKELVKKHQKNMASKSAMDGIVMNMQLRMQIDPNVADNEQRKILSSLFRVLDTDNDGFVTREELQAKDESDENQKIVARFLEIFDKLDWFAGEKQQATQTGDHKLSLEEWHAGLESKIQEVGWEGAFSMEKLCNILTPKNIEAALNAKAQSAFDKIDTNPKDGKLTFKEMTEWCNINPDAATSLFGLSFCLDPKGFGMSDKQYKDLFGAPKGKGWSCNQEEFVKNYLELLADSWPGCLEENSEAADGETVDQAAASNATAAADAKAAKTAAKAAKAAAKVEDTDASVPEGCTDYGFKSVDGKKKLAKLEVTEKGEVKKISGDWRMAGTGKLGFGFELTQDKGEQEGHLLCRVPFEAQGSELHASLMYVMKPKSAADGGGQGLCVYLVDPSVEGWDQHFDGTGPLGFVGKKGAIVGVGIDCTGQFCDGQPASIAVKRASDGKLLCDPVPLEGGVVTRKDEWREVKIKFDIKDNKCDVTIGGIKVLDDVKFEDVTIPKKVCIAVCAGTSKDKTNMICVNNLKIKARE